MPTKSEDLRARLHSIFLVEAQEHLQTITANLLALDRGLSPAEARRVTEATFRAVHTLKGAARSVSQTDAEAICQAMELVFSKITRGEIAQTGPVLQELQGGADGIGRVLTGTEASTVVRALVNRLEHIASGATPGTASSEEIQMGSSPEPPPSERSGVPVVPGPPVEDTIRVSAARLDAVLLRAEQLLLPKLFLGQAVRETKVLLEAVGRCRAAVERGRGEPGPSSLTDAPDLKARLFRELRALERGVRHVLRGLLQGSQAVSSVVDAVAEGTRHLRLVPVSTILDLFPRMVRDLSWQRGREVEWVARGGGLEVDRRVLEVIKDPLIQLVRNAIDHGIEPPELRREMGKSATARVAVTVGTLEGGRLEFRVEDDGRGIDPTGLRRAAVRAGVITPEAAESLPDGAALDLIFRSGVSTSPVITDVSGHGLGMAIVKERVERLKGEIHVDTRAGAGTTIRMIIPATIATLRGLLVPAAGGIFLLPTDSVERAIRLGPDAAERDDGSGVIRCEGRPLAIVDLARLLGLPRAEATREPCKFCVIIRSGEERLGLLVPEVMEDREVLVREFRPPLLRIRNVAAAGLLGMGQIVLILRPADLIKSARLDGGPRSGAWRQARTLAS